MRFYTKEWYRLMQHQDDTLCMKRIPDKDYSGKEIKALFKKQLKAEIARDRREHNSPPFFLDLSEQLKPENFDPEVWLVFPENEEPRHPVSAEEVLAQLEHDRKQAEEDFANRPPFDPGKSEEMFQKVYKGRMRFRKQRFPEWVCRQVDRRLLALELLPDSVYRRLKEESRQNRRAFQKIERAAEKELSRQRIPDRISDTFHFHDGALLSLRKRGRNYEMLLREDGGWFGEGVTPYIKVIFTDAVLLEREKGLTPRARMEEDGTFWSNCVFLYHEMYCVQDGYEVHMMFATRGRSELAYLTVKCRDICFDDNIVLPVSPKEVLK